MSCCSIATFQGTAPRCRSGFLREQIALVRPRLIICLGRIAAGVLIEKDYRITRQHGQWIERDGIWYTAIYHPSALLRDLRRRPETFLDLLSIRDKVREVCPELYAQRG